MLELFRANVEVREERVAGGRATHAVGVLAVTLRVARADRAEAPAVGEAERAHTLVGMLGAVAIHVLAGALRSRAAELVPARRAANTLEHMALVNSVKKIGLCLKHVGSRLSSYCAQRTQRAQGKELHPHDARELLVCVK